MITQYTIENLPPTLPIPIIKGNSLELPGYIEEGDDPGPFDRVDITGSSFSMVIKQKRGGTTALSLSSDDDAILITDAANGEFKVIITSAQSGALPSDCALTYYLDWTDADGNVTTIMRGEMQIVAK